MKKTSKTESELIEFRSPDYDIVVLASNHEEATQLIRAKIEELQSEQTKISEVTEVQAEVEAPKTEIE